MSARGWVEADDRLTRSIEFKDFSEAFAFMTRVALIAERMGHHPTWTNTYNKVEIRLSTHDAGDVVTDKDRRMAKAIDALLEDQVGRLLLTQKKSAPPDHGGALQ
jgi:4a-hydroxytetrahydrobiopterin dehydratase